MEINKNVYVVTVESRRFFDECQYSYLPEMNKVFWRVFYQRKSVIRGMGLLYGKKR